MKIKILIVLSFFLLESQAQAHYLKELDIDLVTEQLDSQNHHWFFRNYRQNKQIKQLLRRVKLEPHLGFLKNTGEPFKHLVEPDCLTCFDGDIGYEPHTADVLKTYFNFATTEEGQATAQTTFTEALEEMKLKRKRRDIHLIVTKVEEAAEAGYVPAILAYGVMNRHGLFGLHKNLPLAEAFYKVASIGDSGMALGYLAALRSDHYVLGDTLSESLLVHDDRIPEMKLLRAASIKGGNLAFDVAHDYYSILKGDVKRKRLKTIGKVSLQALDGTLDRVEKMADIAGKISPLPL